MRPIITDAELDSKTLEVVSEKLTSKARIVRFGMFTEDEEVKAQKRYNKATRVAPVNATAREKARIYSLRSYYANHTENVRRLRERRQRERDRVKAKKEAAAKVLIDAVIQQFVDATPDTSKELVHAALRDFAQALRVRGCKLK